MKNLYVKDFMVPLSEYATVSEEATLRDAVRALKKAQKVFDSDRYRHRAVLVFDKNNRIVGKLSQHDIIQAIEPNYRNLKGLDGLSRFGLSPALVESLLEQYSLWDRPVEQLCLVAANLKVKEIMYTPAEGEYVSQDASLGAAIHQLVTGKHHSLLVTDGEKIVGILRLTDVFSLISEKLEQMWDE